MTARVRCAAFTSICTRRTRGSRYPKPSGPSRSRSAVPNRSLSNNPGPDGPLYLAPLPRKPPSTASHLVAHLGLAGYQVGHDIVLPLRPGDFDLADLQAAAVNVEELVSRRHF